MTYTQQLEHPKWQLKRLKIIKRDKATCQECGCKEKQLHIHHKRYVYGRMAWEYQDWELTTLCKDCHAKKHPKEKPDPPKKLTVREIEEIISHYQRQLEWAKLDEQASLPESQRPVKVEQGRSIFANVRASLG